MLSLGILRKTNLPWVRHTFAKNKTSFAIDALRDPQLSHRVCEQ